MANVRVLPLQIKYNMIMLSLHRIHEFDALEFSAVFIF